MPESINIGAFQRAFGVEHNTRSVKRARGGSQPVVLLSIWLQSLCVVAYLDVCCFADMEAECTDLTKDGASVLQGSPRYCVALFVE